MLDQFIQNEIAARRRPRPPRPRAEPLLKAPPIEVARPRRRRPRHDPACRCLGGRISRRDMNGPPRIDPRRVDSSVRRPIA